LRSSQSVPSPELRAAAAYHRELVSRLRLRLGSELVGVYAGGSFVLGGYVPDRSDLDVAAVCRASLARELKTEIGEALRHESLPCPARGLELVLYALRSVREATSGAAFELNLNTGRAMTFTLETDPTNAPRHWYVIDRAILREHGRALSGPPARELFARIPREALLRALSESVRWHAEDPAARDDDAVLNACRAWRFATDGVWSSKHDAGLWARARLDDAALVTQALALREREGRLDQDGVNAFLARVQDVLQLDAA
jgi:Domain of unknown function (DUF4111)